MSKFKYNVKYYCCKCCSSIFYSVTRQRGDLTSQIEVLQTMAPLGKPVYSLGPCVQLKHLQGMLSWTLHMSHLSQLFSWDRWDRDRTLTRAGLLSLQLCDTGTESTFWAGPEDQ